MCLIYLQKKYEIKFVLVFQCSSNIFTFRAMYEKGMKAFVSFLQAYAKHECSLIFRWKGMYQNSDYIFV